MELILHLQLRHPPSPVSRTKVAHLPSSEPIAPLELSTPTPTKTSRTPVLPASPLMSTCSPAEEKVPHHKSTSWSQEYPQLSTQPSGSMLRPTLLQAAPGPAMMLLPTAISSLRLSMPSRPKENQLAFILQQTTGRISLEALQPVLQLALHLYGMPIMIMFKPFLILRHLLDGVSLKWSSLQETLVCAVLISIKIGILDLNLIKCII